MMQDPELMERVRKRQKLEAREDPAAFLRALMELGDECSGTYCRATLPTRGADLTIGTDAFEILEPSKGSTKEGTFTCSARE